MMAEIAALEYQACYQT